MKEKWHNYGDVNFLEHGGCLVQEDTYSNCYNVLVLNTNVYDTSKYEEPVIIAMCYIDLSDWLEEDKRKEVNDFTGNNKDYIPNTLKEKMRYCADLINYYGLHEFSPTFPKETGCGTYALGTVEQWVVSREIACDFMKSYDIPEDYRE